MSRSSEPLGASLFANDVDPQAVAWARRTLLLAAWEAMPDVDGGDANCRVPDLSLDVACGNFLTPLSNPPPGSPEFDAIRGGPPVPRAKKPERRRGRRSPNEPEDRRPT